MKKKKQSVKNGKSGLLHEENKTKGDSRSFIEKIKNRNKALEKIKAAIKTKESHLGQ